METFADLRLRAQRWTLAILLAAVPPAVAYEGSGVTDGGTVTGRVRVAGDVTPLPPQPVHKERATCGQTVRDDRLVMGDGGALRFAIVTVDGITAGKPVPRSDLVLHNRGCAFVPHVMSATRGQMLQIVNDDPILHDAHAILGQRTLFNLAIPRGRTVHHSLGDAGLVHINCNVRHTWMHAYVLVDEDPYHAVTDSDGRFTITDVPAGSYRLTTWHEMFGTIETPVTVTPGATVTADVAFPGVAMPVDEGNP